MNTLKYVRIVNKDLAQLILFCVHLKLLQLMTMKTNVKYLKEILNENEQHLRNQRVTRPSTIQAAKMYFIVISHYSVLFIIAGRVAGDIITFTFYV